MTQCDRLAVGHVIELQQQQHDIHSEYCPSCHSNSIGPKASLFPGNRGREKGEGEGRRHEAGEWREAETGSREKKSRKYWLFYYLRQPPNVSW